MGKRIKRKSNRWWVLALLAALAVPAAQAAGPVKKAADGKGSAATNSTLITSRTMNYDRQNRKATFIGDVVVTDPSMKIMADEMLINFSSSNTPEIITATGNVKIWQEDKMSVSKKAVYTVSNGMLVLTGSPVLTRGNDHMTGKRIIFYRDSDRVYTEEATIQFRPGQTNFSLLGPE